MVKVARLILFASLLLAILPASGADVSNYTLAKGKVYNQANAAGPVPKNNVARFFATVDRGRRRRARVARFIELPAKVRQPKRVRRRLS